MDDPPSSHPYSNSSSVPIATARDSLSSRESFETVSEDNASYLSAQQSRNSSTSTIRAPGQLSSSELYLDAQGTGDESFISAVEVEITGLGASSLNSINPKIKKSELTPLESNPSTSVTAVSTPSRSSPLTPGSSSFKAFSQSSSSTKSAQQDSVSSSKGIEKMELNEKEQHIVSMQTEIVEQPAVGFFALFRYHTKLEIALNCLGVICACIAGATQPLMTVVFGNLTTSFVQYAQALLIGGSAAADAKAQLFSTVNADALLLVYIGLSMFVATYIYMYSWITSGEAATRRVRESYLRAVLRQNIAYFDTLGAGEVTTRISTDTTLLQEGISEKVPIAVAFVATFITGFAVALIRNWRLALVVSCIIPLIVMAGAIMGKFLAKYKAAMLEKTAEGGTLVEEVVSSVRNAHAFGTQGRLGTMYDVHNLATLSFGMKSATTNGVGLAFFFLIIYSSYALAFYYGTTLLLRGEATAGAIVNVFLSILIAAFSLAQLAPILSSITFAMGAAKSLYGTIGRVPFIDSASPEGLKPDSVVGEIVLDNVTFVYPSRPTLSVLRNFSAIFPPGKTTALVGQSGSGKSTIIGLLERFYDPVSGSITIDGNPIDQLNLKWLRSQIGLVSQEPILFNTTVAQNIEHGLIGSRFANLTAEEKREKVIEAAKKAHAHPFITALPGGYECMVGERAMLLSGGQAQRICLARAIVSDPKILLLDEATSALDTASEVIVQRALDEASIGRTTITIAHRLSTIKNAQQIIVLTNGIILESAQSDATASAHSILLRNETGAYSRLVNAQKFREEESEEEKETTTKIEFDEKTQIKQEVATFGVLKRTTTSKSTNSEVLASRIADLEAGLEKDYSFRELARRMLILNKARKVDYALGILASIFVGCVYPIFGIVFGSVIGVFSETDPVSVRSGGNLYALYCFILALLAALAVGTQYYAFGASAEYLSAIIRRETFASILRQDIAFFDREENSTGALTAAVSSHAQKVAGLAGVTMGVIIQSIFGIIAGSVIGLAYSWKIALIGIACYPLTIAAGLVRLKVVIRKDAKTKKAHEAAGQLACEAAAAIKTVASLTREDDCLDIYSRSLDEPQRISNRTAIFANLYYSISQALTFPVIALIFYVGSHFLADGQLTSKAFFITMISIVFSSINAGQVFTFVPDMSQAKGAAAAFITLLDAQPSIDAQSTEGKKLQATTLGKITLDKVHFRYPTRPHVPVLRGLTLTVEPGQFVAIVGPSGCGKSTTIALLERFYDPLSGSVAIDGQDLSELNVNSYRSQVALVSQQPTLYAGTVAFNVGLGSITPVTQEIIEQACRDANIHDFVSSLPQGYETEVGGKGAQLSGGQRQRICIARALVRNPKVLLLDEATSALDSESEKVVQAALDAARKNRTCIAIAHRLSTIQNADMIFVLKDGVVAESGKHFELLAKKSIYFELVTQQDLEKR